MSPLTKLFGLGEKIIIFDPVVVVVGARAKEEGLIFFKRMKKTIKIARPIRDKITICLLTIRRNFKNSKA